MSATDDLQAIEKGLKDIIFNMSSVSSGETLSSEELNLTPNFTPNCYSIDNQCCSSNLEKSHLPQSTMKLSYKNQSNSSELIDLDALTEFSAKHIDDPNFKAPTKEIKLPHPDLEDECQVGSSSKKQSTNISTLFEKIQNSPNFGNLPENPLPNHLSGSPKRHNVGKESQPKDSPSRKRKDSVSKKKKKRRRDKSGKQKNNFVNLLNGPKTADNKDLGSKQMTCFKVKKNAFTIGKEYSLIMERNVHKFHCSICDFTTDLQETINKHVTSKGHLQRKEITDKDLMLPFLPEFLPAQIEAITDVLTNEVALIGLQKEDLSLRNALSLKFKNFIEDNVSICKVELIGSSVYGIGLKCSEVDFVIKVENDDIVPDALEAIFAAVSKGDAYGNVVDEFKQKRPRVRFTDHDTGLTCNVLIDNSSGCKLANLLSTYCKLDDRVLTLGTALRYWAKLCDIDQQDRGTLPSFSFALFLVHFLQQVEPPVLPVLNEETDYVGSPEFYSQYIMENRWKSQNTDSIGELWLKFFRYYTFEYKIGESIVSIRSFKRSTCSERNWTTRFYAIEEPFLRRNIAYVIPSFQVCQFIQNCFVRTYRYFAYPQLKKGTIKLLKTDNFDPLNLPEFVSQKPILKEEEPIDSDVSENEDSTLDPLSISQDLEDHDPDVPIEDLISTVTNFQLEDNNSDDKSENTKKPITNSQLENTVSELVIGDTELVIGDIKEKGLDKENQSKFLTKYDNNKQIPICYWDTEGKEISKELFNYSFEINTFKGDKNVPLTCTNCKKSGHRKQDCPNDDLPKPHPLPEMTEQYLNIIDEALIYIWEKNNVSENHFKEVEIEMLDIEQYIKEEFPDAKLSLFGSFRNGFGFRNKSDMDFCLTFKDIHDGKELDSISIIHKVAAQLKNHPKLENVLAITSAKVPIVKFQWKDTGVEGDISLYNTLALNNTEMLEAYSKIDIRVQILGYALKYFAKTLGICDASRGSLSSYAYILMVLYFLQQRNPPVIPVLQELYEGEKPTKLIDDWNVWFYKDINKLKDVWPDYKKNNESVAELWIGLLHFYACEFDWKEYVISIKQKSLLRRFKKLWISDEIAIEVSGKRSSKKPKGVHRSSWAKKQITIEDPFDLNHNLGGGLSRKMNTYILKAFIRGRERFGTPPPPDKIHQMYRKEVTYLFNRTFLNSGCEPPHDRGCGNCGKIGHLRKDCPQEKTCSYCRKPGHLVKNCPRKKSWPRDRGISKDRNRKNKFNYDSPNTEKRGNAENKNSRTGPLQKPRSDFAARNFPGLHMQNLTGDRLDSQQQLLQMQALRMPPPGFPGRTPNPPPGFKANASLHQKSSNYPPAFNSPHPHVPPFPVQPNKIDMHSQSPPKHYASSPPKNFPPNNTYHQMPQHGWQPGSSRHAGLPAERHPNPPFMERHKRSPWQNRQRDPHMGQHNSNQYQYADPRHNRTNSDNLPYNSSHVFF